MRIVLTAAFLLFTSPYCLAQQSETRWFGPSKVFGAVRSIRVEKATFENQNDALSEGPRVLLQTATYNEDGTRVEITNYRSDASVGLRTVEQFDKTGHLLERTTFGPHGQAMSRWVWVYDDNGRWKTLTIHGADGSVGKTTFTYDGNFRFQTTENYDHNGVLIAKITGKLDMRTHRSEIISQDRAATSQRTSAFTDTADSQTYEATRNGQLTDKTVNTKTPNGGEMTQYNPDGSVMKRSRAESKTDSHGNAIQTTWFEQVTSGDFHPTNIIYRTFTYYDNR
jgi:antitoxin component YwqK of YwqJK toxin-antitoxin module